MSRPSPFGADKPRSASGPRPSPADPASARADGARLNRRLYRGRTASSVSSRADGPRRFAGLRPFGRVPLTLCENPLSALSGVLPDREDAVAAMLYLLAVRAGADPETRVYVFPGGALGLEGNGAILCGDAPRSAVREWAGWLGFDRVLRGTDGFLSRVLPPSLRGRIPPLWLRSERVEPLLAMSFLPERGAPGGCSPSAASTAPDVDAGAAVRCLLRNHRTGCGASRSLRTAPPFDRASRPPAPPRSVGPTPDGNAPAVLPTAPPSASRIPPLSEKPGENVRPGAADSLSHSVADAVRVLAASSPGCGGREAQERIYWELSLMQRRGCGEVFTLGGSTACLFRTPYGALLENVATEPALRGQGRASRLLNEILRDCEGPVCLLCDPALEGFYARAGFRRAGFAGLEPAGK